MPSLDDRRSWAAAEAKTFEASDRTAAETVVVDMSGDGVGEPVSGSSNISEPGAVCLVPPMIEDAGVGLSQLFGDVPNVEIYFESADSGKLGELQRADSTLTAIFTDLRNQETDKDAVNCYSVNNKTRLLMRAVPVKTENREGDNGSFAENSVPKQIVVPYCLRAKLLDLAHSLPVHGHQSTKRTIQRLTQYFFWPHIYKDVKQYCASCDVCQKLHKSGKLSKAPMMTPPIVDKPFSRLSVDVMGPLPTTRSNNRFIIVIVDHCTRWAECYARPNHTAVTITRCVADFMTHFGVADSVLHDLGADFTSEMFKVFLNYFGIDQFKCSVAHAQTNTTVERTNGSIKSMLRAFVAQHSEDWDEGLCYVSFAYRELPIGELGFSPYELVFGKAVQSPLTCVYNAWWEEGKDAASPHVIDHMLKQREFIEHALETVVEQRKVAQMKSKVWYDKKARSTQYNVGDLVLVRQTQPGKPLDLKYLGPYKVLKQTSPVDYLINFGGKRKPQRVIHANLLKKYVTRTEFIAIVNGGSDTEQLFPNEPPDEDEGDEMSMSGRQQAGDFVTLVRDKTKHLSDPQAAEMQALLYRHASVFADRPGCAKEFEYHIRLKPDARPVAQHPYRLSPTHKQLLQQEIKQMLEDDLIEPAGQEWASPVIVIPKADGTARSVIDYRKCNTMIEGDTFPMARIDDMLDEIGQASYLTKLDLSKGFYQMPLSPGSRPITTFCTPFGSYMFKRVPMGMKTSPACFNAMMAKCLTDSTLLDCTWTTL
jgi:hypothetical protein